MKTTTGLMLALTIAVCACKKNNSDPADTTPSCKITINDTTIIMPDSMRWDLYSNGYYRMQAFKKDEATFTIWTQSIGTGSKELIRQSIYWYDGTAIYTLAAGVPASISLTNHNNLLDGELATTGGSFYSGTVSHAGDSKIAVTFRNMPEKK